MAAVQAEDVRALNGYHQDWLGFTSMNHHGVAAFDFETVNGCDQLVFDVTHSRDETIDFLMTYVPDIVQVVVVAPIGNSDHSILSTIISMAQTVPKLCVS